jgi:hypothetical protein
MNVHSLAIPGQMSQMGLFVCSCQVIMAGGSPNLEAQHDSESSLAKFDSVADFGARAPAPFTRGRVLRSRQRTILWCMNFRCSLRTEGNRTSESWQSPRIMLPPRISALAKRPLPRCTISSSCHGEVSYDETFAVVFQFVVNSEPMIGEDRMNVRPLPNTRSHDNRRLCRW